MSDIEDRIKQILADMLSIKPAKVTDDAAIFDDLGADSLDAIELLMAFDQEFGIQLPDDLDLDAGPQKVQTVGDLVRLVERLVAEQEGAHGIPHHT